MMWIAKNKDTGFEYSKKFSSIYDCQNYIHNELLHDLKIANEEYENKKMEEFFIKHPNYSFNKEVLKILFSIHCNRILCYNVEQQRFADGFDF